MSDDDDPVGALEGPGRVPAVPAVPTPESLNGAKIQAIMHGPRGELILTVETQAGRVWALDVIEGGTKLRVTSPQDPPPMPGLDESIVPGRKVGPGETDHEGLARSRYGEAPMSTPLREVMDRATDRGTLGG